MGLAQRLKKLESTIGPWKQPVAEAPEVERTDEEWADSIGDFLWWPKGADMDYPPRSPDSFPRDGPLRAWYEAAELARQEGHRDYHIGLRPYAMAVWLDWKPEYLQACRKHRDWVRVHGEWIWDTPPRFNGMTLDEFKQLPPEEMAAVLRDQGSGHWSKDAKRR